MSKTIFASMLLDIHFVLDSNIGHFAQQFSVRSEFPLVQVHGSWKNYVQLNANPVMLCIAKLIP